VRLDAQSGKRLKRRPVVRAVACKKHRTAGRSAHRRR